jgi:uncharacterized protein YbjT (DUF2867 family)
MSAFVAGATGYTGREVVRILRADGKDVVAHVRPDSSRLEHWRETFEALGATINTTAWDERALIETLRTTQPRVIFGLLGTTRHKAKTEGIEGAIYEKIDYGLTAMLMRAAIAAGGHPRFVYLSALGVGQRPPRGAYMRARWQIERELADSPLPWVVARPTFISGTDREESRPGERVGTVVVDGLLKAFGAIGAGKLARRFQSQTGAELAQSMVRLAYDPAAANRVFEGAALHDARD